MAICGCFFQATRVTSPSGQIGPSLSIWMHYRVRFHMVWRMATYGCRLFFFPLIFSLLTCQIHNCPFFFSISILILVIHLYIFCFKQKKFIFQNKKYLFLNNINDVFDLTWYFFRVWVYSISFICVYLLGHEFFRM